MMFDLKRVLWRCVLNVRSVINVAYFYASQSIKMLGVE